MVELRESSRALAQLLASANPSHYTSLTNGVIDSETLDYQKLEAATNGCRGSAPTRQYNRFSGGV